MTHKVFLDFLQSCADVQHDVIGVSSDVLYEGSHILHQEFSREALMINYSKKKNSTDLHKRAHLALCLQPSEAFSGRNEHLAVGVVTKMAELSMWYQCPL